MDAIFKVNNVYVTVKNNEVREGVEVTNLEDLIISTKEKTSASLYGGRIILFKYNDMFCIKIDGIKIRDLSLYKDGDVDVKVSFDLERIAAYLNQIENLGIETFLENYKKQLENLKEKLEGISTELQQNLEDEKDKERFSSLHGTIIKINSFLFALYVNMNAGIEMQDYIDAYNTIINMYF